MLEVSVGIVLATDNFLWCRILSISLFELFEEVNVVLDRLSDEFSDLI